MKKILLVLFTLISLSAFAQTNGDIVDRLNATLGVRLPAEFEAKVKEFAANDTIMRTRSATAFTEQFIIEQFKNDWGIDRQNQLLFMWSKIYGGISQKKLYNWLDDDNKERSSEYKKCLKNISEFYESYKKGFKEYMEQKSAEAKRKKIDENITKIKGYINDIRDGLINLEALKKDGYLLKDTEKSIIDFKEREKEIIAKFDILNKSIQNNKTEEIDQYLSSSNQLVSESAKLVSAISKQRSAEAKRQSAEAQQRSAEAITNSLKNFVWFFNRYHMKDKEAIPPDETQAWKNKAMEVFIRCKDINLNYKAILRKELGDDKKVQELLKFYGVE